MSKILIIADDDIGPVMAGPGMRFIAFATALAPHHAVTMAVPHEITWQPSGWSLVPYSRHGGELNGLIDAHDVIICKGLSQFYYPILQTTERIVICDLYDPFMFENLEANPDLQAADTAYMYQFNL